MPKRGKAIRVEGACRCDASRGVLSLRAELFGREYRKDLILRGGKICFMQTFAGKPLALRFVSTAAQG